MVTLRIPMSNIITISSQLNAITKLPPITGGGLIKIDAFKPFNISSSLRQTKGMVRTIRYSARSPAAATFGFWIIKVITLWGPLRMCTLFQSLTVTDRYMSPINLSGSFYGFVISSKIVWARTDVRGVTFHRHPYLYGSFWNSFSDIEPVSN